MKLPEAFEHMMSSQLGDVYPRFTSALTEPSPVSVRKNHRKIEQLGLSLPLFDGEESVGWCSAGCYLPSRPSFTYDPLLHAGAYYVQEASSMFVEQFVRQHGGEQPLVALDMCAAPGGKSTLLSTLLPKGSLLVSNEIVRHRCHILCENMMKWGDPSVVVTNNSPSDYRLSGLQFDLILCDAPCSGEGMFRKDPQSVDEWSEENVAMCAVRQREILTDCWECLKPGGLLLYSTCTYNKREDEENAAFIYRELGGEALPLDLEEHWGVDTHNYAGDGLPVYHFFPHQTRGEGFFICGFRKPTEDEEVGSRKKDKRKKESRHQAAPIPKEIKEWICSADEFSFTSDEGESYYAFPKQYMPFLELVKNRLSLMHYGINLASVKGKKIRPDQSLALSNLLNKVAFPMVELDLATALSYLRCEALSLADAPRGFVLMTYQGYPLGFVNNIGNRANNLYPELWRIRSKK